MISIRVDGEPAPQGSKVVGRHGGMYEASSKKLKIWRDAIAWQVKATGQPPFTTAVTVQITLELPRPAGHFGTGRNRGQVRAAAEHKLPATRPDVDKLARAVLDALKMGGAYGDDGQVTDLQVSKKYPKPGGKPGAWIDIAEAEPWD